MLKPIRRDGWLRSRSKLGAHVIFDLTSSEIRPNTIEMRARLTGVVNAWDFLLVLASNVAFLSLWSIPAFQF